MAAFLTDASREALTQSIRTVEAESSVEVVVAVEPSSQSYLHADLSVAIAVGLASLLFVVFSPWPFAWDVMVAEPVLAGFVAGVLSSRSSPPGSVRTARPT